jgi:hypothetical protein
VLDEKVLELIDAIDSALLLVLEADTNREDGIQPLTPNQKEVCKSLMRQVGECIAFVRDYARQSYCM